MIGLFKGKTTKTDLITFNGDYILDNICLKAIVTEELNGDYGLDCTFLINKSIKSEVYENIVEDSILKIDEEYGVEYFRICQVSKNRRDITTYARHISISDILTMWCEDVRPTNLNGQGALSWIFDNAKGENWFNVSSNISDKASAYYINKNVYEALFDSDNSFMDRWGGEVERRGFNIKINAKIGTDRGVSIRSRKNLLGFEASTNLNSLTTRIYPKGYNGITIEEKYIDSPIIGNYGKIYTREVKFDDIRVNDEEYTEGFKTLKEAQDELKKRVNKMYEVDKCDVVSASYRVDFVQLEKTEEYKNYSIIEKTWLGDTVEVIEENLDINIMVRVVKRTFDVLRDMRTETELSNKDLKIKPPSLGDIITEIEKIPSQDDTLQKAKENATALINAGLKDSNVIVRKDEIIVGDTKDINTMTKCWRFNVNGLGYSSSGYYGEYGLAMTMDGAIVADFITTGILNANLIKTGMLKSFNNLTWINMEDGTFDFGGKLKWDGSKMIMNGNFIQYASSGKKSVDIQNNTINIYDWERNGDFIGAMYSGTVPGESYAQMVLKSDTGNPLNIGCGESGGPRIILSDNDAYEAPIYMFGDIAIVGKVKSKRGVYLNDYGALELFGNDETIPLAQLLVGAGTNDTWLVANNEHGNLYLGDRTTGGKYTPIVEVKQGGVTIFDNLKVTGSINGVSNRIANLENAILQNEGLI